MRASSAFRLVCASESDNQSAIRDLVIRHKRIKYVERRNGGGMKTEYTSTGGRTKTSFTWFYELWRAWDWVTSGRQKMEEWPMVALDIEGWLTDNRFFGIEVKAGNWVKPTTPRERQQAERIRFIRSIGGVAGFVTSPEQAQEMIES